MSEFGKYIKILREAENLSLQDVADRAGMSKAHIWDLEMGKTKNPRADTMFRLSIVFDRDPEKLAYAAFADCRKTIKAKTKTINSVKP